MKRKLPCFFVFLCLLFSINIVNGQDSGCMDEFRPINMDIENMECSNTGSSECFTISFDLDGCSEDVGEYFIWVDGELIINGVGESGQHIELNIELSRCQSCRTDTRLIECGASNGSGMAKEGGIVVIQG